MTDIFQQMIRVQMMFDNVFVPGSNTVSEGEKFLDDLNKQTVKQMEDAAASTLEPQICGMHKGD